MVSSSRMGSTPMESSNRSMQVDKSMPKSTETQVMPSLIPHVPLLLEDKHVVVEELLELLVDKVDAKLLKSVEFENLETGNIQHTNKVDLLHGGVNEGSVTHVHQVSEETTVDVLDDGGGADSNGSQILCLVDPLCSDLVLGVDKGIIESLARLGELEDLINQFSSLKILGRGDLTNTGELQGGEDHAHGGHSVHVVLLGHGKAENIESFVH